MDVYFFWKAHYSWFAEEFCLRLSRISYWGVAAYANPSGCNHKPGFVNFGDVLFFGLTVLGLSLELCFFELLEGKSRSFAVCFEPG